jgi:hypothetical protein
MLALLKPNALLLPVVCADAEGLSKSEAGKRKAMAKAVAARRVTFFGEFCSWGKLRFIVFGSPVSWCVAIVEDVSAGCCLRPHIKAGRFVPVDLIA